VLGKKDSADEGPTRFNTAPKGSEADVGTPQLVVPVTNAAGWNTTDRSEANTTEPTPEVKNCPAGSIAVGSRCFKSSAGSRKGMAGTLAGSVALLAAWQLAVVLATALLAC
jgi:hypothetical protein